MLTLLEDHFENESLLLANHVIAAVFWDVRGTLGLKHVKQWIVIQRPMQTQSNSIIDQSGRKKNGLPRDCLDAALELLEENGVYP